MKKNIFKAFLLGIIYFLSFQLSYWIDTENNILFDAFSERRDKLIQLLWWWELETQINVLKENIELLNLENNLNNNLKEKLLSDIDWIYIDIENLKWELINNIESWDEFEQLLDNYNNEINLKKDLVTELNNSIKQNQLNEEKISILLDRYLNEKSKIDEENKNNKSIKIYIFIIFTLLTIAIYIVSLYFSKKQKISNKKSVYINFFLLFSYVIFLIWFFFYLYPELSIFLIFISWYLLVINAHLIWSFIWSVIVLERFKIWDVIKFNDIEWQVIKINPLYVVLMPLTKEWIFKNKPIYVPHINILKESVTKDISAWTIIHNFELTIRDDWNLDIMKFIEWVEQNILTKFLSNRLSSLSWLNDTYRTSFERTNMWHIVVVFIWKWDDILNKKVERKIVWYLYRLVLDSKKAKELSEKNINEINDNEIKEAN